jgi:hypothetical protein
VNLVPSRNRALIIPFHRRSAHSIGNRRMRRPQARLGRITLDEGAVVLTWPNELSKESVHELEGWLAVLIGRARRKAGVSPPQATAIQN